MPGWILGRHLKLICDTVQAHVEGRLLNEDGEEYFALMLNTPPQHGKSQAVSETLPSWYHGKSPRNKIIELSYNDMLAERFGRRNRQKIVQYGKSLFNIELSKSTDHDYEIAEYNGTYMSRGIMSGVTGNPGDLMIIDDPLKNKEEADSTVMREKIWDEWQASLRTRFSANGKLIVIMTRWHEDDLGGRLIKALGSKRMKVINIPCEAEENDILGREIGDPLFPEIGKNKKWLQQTKADYENDPREGGIRVWNALYQGKPFSEEGNIFKKKHWKYYDVKDLPNIKFEMEFQSWDMSFTDTESSCRVAGQVWGNLKSNLYLLDLRAKRMDFKDSMKQVEDITERHPKAFMKLVENKANGPAIISMLNMKIGGFVPIDPKGSKEVQGGGSKVARAQAVAPLQEAGNVYLPCEGYNPDGTPILSKEIKDYMDEMGAFPQSEYDDQVDASTQAWRRFIYTILPEIIKKDEREFPEEDFDDYHEDGESFYD
jgi:predicted phage terminase large subunit-like protein